MHPWEVLAVDARRAFERGDLDLAERLLDRAEKLREVVMSGAGRANPFLQAFYENEAAIEQRSRAEQKKP